MSATTQTDDLRDILRQVNSLPNDWHGAGSLSPATLRALVRLYPEGEELCSAETGTGKSTLLFSHLSACHTVFTLDEGGSLGAVKKSPLCNRKTVTFVEGPSQKTLPAHGLRGPLHAVLLDGPHAYPFPELEYFYLYPHLACGGLLVIDDIHIPTIGHLVSFLKKEPMFRLETVTGKKTAFFRRTGHRVFNPYGDGWWLQGINRKAYPGYKTWWQKLLR